FVFFQAEDGIRDFHVTGVQTCALPICLRGEGVEAPVILWAVAREIRQLANISQQYSQGTPLDRAFSQARPPVWDKRKPLVSKAQIGRASCRERETRKAAAVACDTRQNT